MIDKWTILHLERRHDRAPFAFSNAERFGVPRAKVRFWYAKDVHDFKDGDAIIDAAISDGFTGFEAVRGTPEDFLGHLCKTWNVLRYLRDLAENDSIEMFINDGILMRPIHNTGNAMQFCPDFKWLCDVVKICVDRPKIFRLLIMGTLNNEKIPIKLIRPDSLILEGAHSLTSSVRVFSSAGAKETLKSYQKKMETGLFVDNNMHKKYGTRGLPGTYTFIDDRVIQDMPGAYFGSDSQNKAMNIENFGIGGPEIYNKYRELLGEL